MKSEFVRLHDQEMIKREKNKKINCVRPTHKHITLLH